MPPAFFFCAPAVGLKEALLILVLFATLIAFPLWTYWRKKRLPRREQQEDQRKINRSGQDSP